MSTANVRKALAMLDVDHPNAPSDAGVTLTRAVAEVDAIERAAKDVARWGVGDVCGLVTAESWGEDIESKAATEKLTESIAKDAPK
jgi:hypothetical protein